MLKIFRKYNKIILVIGGTLLMIAFLIPQALQQLGRSAAGAAVVRFDGGSFAVRDLQRAEAELNALEATLGLDKQAIGVENNEHWLMLVVEAQRAGFRGGPSDAEAMINQVAAGYARQMASQDPSQADKAYTQARSSLLQRRLQVSGGNPEGIDSALIDLFAIQRLRAGYFAAPKLSTVRTIEFADRILDTARIQASIVPADSLLADIPQPSTAELEAQFEKYQDVDHGEGEYGFGYRQPVRVKVEWITLDPRAVAAAVTLDPIDVRKRFEAKRDLYPGEFVAERENIRRDLTNDKVAAIMTDADQTVRGHAADDVRDFPENRESGLRALPENWFDQRTPLETIADDVVARIKEKYGVTIARPYVGVKNDAWLTPAEFQQLPGLGRSFVRDGLRAYTLANLLGEINDSMPADTNGKTAKPRFQVGVLDRPSLDSANQQHYFRFLAAKPAGPAASIDDARDDVTRDLRRLKAYDTLLERAQSSSARDALVARGPKAAANTLDPTVGESVINVSDERAAPVGNPFAGELLTRVVEDDAFRAPIMEAARALDPLQPIDVQSLDARSLVVPAPGALAVVFARITARDPLTRQEFDQLQAQIVAAAMQNEFANIGATGNPFSFDRMKERLNYKEVGRRARVKHSSAENDDAEDDDAPPAETPAHAGNP